MSRLDLKPRGNFRTVRGGALPPRAKTSHRSKPAAPEVLSRPDVTVKPLTLFEILGGTSENPAPSKFGGTTLERAADNAAARLNFEFDAAQFVVSLTINGNYTVIDRILFHPRTAVYLDGPQHDIREAADPKDLLQDLELRSEGWLVIRIGLQAMMRDPIGSIQQVLYAT